MELLYFCSSHSTLFEIRIRKTDNVWSRFYLRLYPKMYIPKSNFCTVEFSLETDLSLGVCMSMFVQRLVVHIALQKVLIEAKASIRCCRDDFLVYQVMYWNFIRSVQEILYSPLKVCILYSILYSILHLCSRSWHSGWQQMTRQEVMLESWHSS